MDMCENLLTSGYLYECNSTYIWISVAIIIFMLIMTTVAVILIIGKIKQKHKQKEELYMSGVNEKLSRLSRLLNINVHGQDDANKASFEGFEEQVTFELKKQTTRQVLAKEFAKAKHQSAELDQLQEEIDISLEAIDIERKKVDFKKLKLLATRLGQPVECILIEQAPAGITYIEKEESCSILSALKQEEESYDLLVEAGFEDISDLSELPFTTVDDLIKLYADFDVTDEVKYITGKLVILQLKGKVRKSKRQEYLELLRGMTAELSKDDYAGLSENVDEFKAANNALVNEQGNSDQEEISDIDSNNIQDVETQVQPVIDIVLKNNPLFLSNEDDEFMHLMFEKIDVLKFQVNNWEIDIKQEVKTKPIDFNIIGKQKLELVVEKMKQSQKMYADDANYLRALKILKNILVKFQ